METASQLIRCPCETPDRLRDRLGALLRQKAWILLVVILFSGFLGARGLNEPDEGRYAEIAREMALNRDWLVPTLNGFEHFQKPPLIYWFTAGAIRLFGANEWAVRLPPMLSALGVVLLTCAVGRRLFGEAAGRNAGMILATSLEFFIMARLLTPDMLMALFIVGAITAFVSRRPWWFFVAMGLGFLTKGPMALIVPLSAAICWQVSARGTPEFRKVPWVRGMALTLLIGLSWFIALSLLKPQLFEYFWKYELVERFASGTHGRSKPLWYFAPILPLALFPWILFVWIPVREFRRWFRVRAWAPRHVLLVGWILIPFFFLSLSGSKLITYILPLLPACALMLGAGLTRAQPRLVPWVAGGMGLVYLGLAANAPFIEHRLGRQCSMRHLAYVAEFHPDGDGALIFTSGVRAHGLEFYLGSLVYTTRADADIVLPLDWYDAARVFAKPRHIAKRFGQRAGKVPERAIGVIEKGEFGTVFKEAEWRIVAEAGDFLLISNAGLWREPIVP